MRHVRESLVRLKKSDPDYRRLTESGFHLLEDSDDEVLLGRHQLARWGEALDRGQNVFRPLETKTPHGVASAPSQASVPSLTGSVSSPQNKKQKKA